MVNFRVMIVPTADMNMGDKVVECTSRHARPYLPVAGMFFSFRYHNGRESKMGRVKVTRVDDILGLRHVDTTIPMVVDVEIAAVTLEEKMEIWEAARTNRINL